MRSAALYQPSAIQVPFILDKTVTWADESTTHVKIRHDGLIYLDGVPRKLLSFEIGVNGFVPDYMHADIKPILNTELAYLYGVGMRIMTGSFNWISAGGDITLYENILDVVYDNKMLFIPNIVHKWDSDGAGTEFNNCDTNFAVGASTRNVVWALEVDKLLEYDNVIAINMENEIDLLLVGQTYTPAKAATYISAVQAIIKSKTNLPTTIKFMGYWDNVSVPIQAACQQYSAVPCYDPYTSTPALFAGLCRSAKHWSGKNNFWIYECAAPSAALPDNTALTVDMITTMFNNGANLVTIYPMNRNHAGQTALECHFDADGVVKANFNDNLAPQISTWQSPL